MRFRDRYKLKLKRSLIYVGRGKTGLQCQTSKGWAAPGWAERTERAFLPEEM